MPSAMVRRSITAVSASSTALTEPLPSRSGSSLLLSVLFDAFGRTSR
jgi:hypothetical protein